VSFCFIKTKKKRKRKMPRKKKLPPVVSAEQAEKERKPAVTVGMGFKMSKVSSDNWKAQIRKEEQIHREWIRTHAPDLATQENESVRRFQERQVELATIRSGINERSLLVGGVSKEGQGRALYLKERLKKGPTEKFLVPITEQQMLGWQATTSELVKGRLTVSMSEKNSKPRSKPHNIVEQELEAGGWCQIATSSNHPTPGV
jgi:hypothetical protein